VSIWFRFTTFLLLSIAAVTARAQERDILDSVLERPQTIVIYQTAVRFADAGLDSAERSLHDVLPRPWTLSRILPLFEAAATREADPQPPTANPADRVQDEWVALVEHLGAVLAASRDPRAALALDRLIRGPDSMVKCRIIESFLMYFNAEPGYRRPQPEQSADVRPRFVNICTIRTEQYNKWWNLNREEVERRAVAAASLSLSCESCAQESMAAIEQIRQRLHATAPRLQLTVEGGEPLRMVQVTSQIRIQGQAGTTSYAMQNDSPATEIRLRIPARLLGRNDLAIAGLVISPGFKTTVIDSTQINSEQRIPVRLETVPSKTLTGTVTFQDGQPPGRFEVRANMRITKANVSPEIFTGGSFLQFIAEGVVDQTGRFSIAIPDITKDPILNSPGNWFELTAQPNSWVLEPTTMRINHNADTELALTATPRGRASQQ
jgi:hypothetical protein